LNRALALGPQDVDVLFAAALVYQELRQSEKAMVFLRQAAEGGYSMAEVRSHPDLQALHEEPEFQQLTSE
jgi:hypothetical protein